MILSPVSERSTIAKSRQRTWNIDCKYNVEEVGIISAELPRVWQSIVDEVAFATDAKRIEYEECVVSNDSQHLRSIHRMG